MIGSLGCGSYTVYLQSVGLEVNLGELDATQVSYSRGYGTQTGQVVIPTPGAAECAPLLAELEKWRYEIAVYREPGGRVASGPVTAFEYTPDQATITFSDLSAWYGKRKIHDDHRFKAADVATMFHDYHHDAIDVDNRMGYQLVSSPINITQTVNTLAGQHLMASDAIANLEIDWYVLDRTAYAGGVAVGGRPVATLWDDHFIVTPTIASGDGEANLYGVRGAGAGDGNDPVYRQVNDHDAQERYGLLEAVDTVDTLTSNADAETAAFERLALLGSPPLLVSSGALSQDVPVSIGELTPGALVVLSLTETVKPVLGTYRLSAISVNVQGGDETVTIETQPVGSLSYRLTHPPSKAFEKVFQKLLRDTRRMRNGSTQYGEANLGSIVHFGPATLTAVVNPDTGEVHVTLSDTLTGNGNTPIATLP